MVVFPTETLELPSDGMAAAGVSAFGFGGTNAHAVLTRGSRQCEAIPPPVAMLPSSAGL